MVPAHGGGIYSNGGTVTITTSALSGNTVLENGGAIAVFGGSLTMDGSVVTHNNADQFGGGIYVDPAMITIISCTFADNNAPVGADLYNLDSTVTIIASSLTGLYNPGGTVTNPIADLLGQVAALNLSGGQTNSLTTKLQTAQESLASGNNKAAVHQLDAFINQLNALANSHRLGELTADSLINEVDNLVELIG